MRFLSLYLLFALNSIASSIILDDATDVSSLLKATGGKNATVVSKDQLHTNILTAMHPDHIIHSDNLYDYFSDNHGANHTIYVNNTRAFIDMSQVKPQLGKRQYAK